MQSFIFITGRFNKLPFKILNEQKHKLEQFGKCFGNYFGTFKMSSNFSDYIDCDYGYNIVFKKNGFLLSDQLMITFNNFLCYRNALARSRIFFL